MGYGTRALTLTLGGSATSLYTAITAVSGYTNAAPFCSFVQVRGDDSLSGSEYVYVGDSNVTTSSYGNRLGAGTVQPYAFGFSNSVSLKSIYVLGSTTGLKVNVTWAESA